MLGVKSGQIQEALGMARAVVYCDWTCSVGKGNPAIRKHAARKLFRTTASTPKFMSKSKQLNDVVGWTVKLG